MLLTTLTHDGQGHLLARAVVDSVANTLTVFDGAGAQQSQRALTAAEQVRVAEEVVTRTAETNRQTIQTRAQVGLVANAAFLALPTPTNPQTLAQVQTLTKECTGIIKLLLGLLDDTAGT